MSGWLRTHLAGLAATALALTLAQGAGAAEVGGESQVIGHSVLGREITAVHRLGPGEPSKTLVVIGLIHGDERAGLRVVDRLLAVDLPPGLDLWVIPSGNPDGQARNIRRNAHGVDLNRNFPRGWRASRRGSLGYSGPARASEPETQALMAFLSATQPDATLIFHQALHGVDTSIARTRAFGRVLAREMALPRKSFRCSGTCHGTLTRWLNAGQPGLAVTIELSARPSAQQVRRAAGGAIAATMAYQ